LAGYTFSEPPTIRGVQWRAGAELEWAAPAFRVAGEYQYLSQERDGITDSQRIGAALVPVGDLEPLVVRGWYVEASGHVFGEDDAQGDPRTGLEIAARFESLDFGDGRRTVAVADGEEDHAPLVDSWVEAVTAGVSGYFGWGLRVGLAWQAVRFGRADLAPDHEEGDVSGGDAWVHHVFARAQFEY
jgi:hypothetical protein